MIDLNKLKDNPKLAEKLTAKGSTADINHLFSLNNSKNAFQVELDDLKNKKNELSKLIGELAKNGENIDKHKNKSNEINDSINTLQEKFNLAKTELSDLLLSIPNIPDDDVPIGSNEEANIVVSETVYTQKSDGLDHTEIGELIDGVDFNKATLISGARFVVLKGKVAKLQRALIQFMLDEAESNGYLEQYVPYIVNAESLIGTGQLPKFEEDQFKVDENKYLIPTAEVPLTNLLRDTTLNESDLPIKLTAHTPCFRSEAGNYGKDTKGMIRQHQFEKVELVKFVHPEKSDKALEDLTDNAAQLLDKLELSYRKVVLCTGDLGFSSAKTIDLEVWLPSQGCFREISSCSNFRDFQARRINVKVKNANNKYIPHTLNGSALAVGRTLVAILENNYVEGEGVHVPTVLSKYLDFSLIEEKS
ncbi:MAG: serine--tRNA ligase [Gammaproteobacteria bacterium]